MTSRLAALVAILVACNADDGDKPADTDLPTDTDLPGTTDTDTEPTTECDAPEIPYDGIDNDCVGGDLKDVDGDGFNALVTGGPDCDDDAAEVYPTAFDALGDGIDTNCDGVDGTDADGDGFASKGSGGLDCDDLDPAAIWPLVSVAPASGEVAADAVFSATFAGDPTGAVLSLTLNGNSLPASTITDGFTMTLTPDAPLPAGGSFDFRVEGPCGEDEVVTVTTPSVPLDPGLLTGRGWSLDFLNGTFVTPAAFAGPAPGIGNGALLLAVPVADLGRTAASNLAAPPAQYPCIITADAPMTWPDDTTVSLFWADVHADISASEVVIEDATLTGTSTDGGATLGGFTLAGKLKVTSLAPLLGGPACTVLGFAGVKCGPCAHSLGNDCVDVEITDIPSFEVPGLVVDVRTEADILADPSCP